MNSLFNINLYQGLPDKLRFLKSKRKAEKKNKPFYYQNISVKNSKAELSNIRRVLICFPIDAYWSILDDNNLKDIYFNYVGFLYNVIEAFEDYNYIVDFVHNNFEGDFVSDNHYDLFLGHGPYCKKIIDNIKVNKVIQYASSAYCESFLTESNERYHRYQKRNNIKSQVIHKRDINDIFEGEEYLTNRADYIFLAGNCPRMINTFSNFLTTKTIFPFWSSYPNYLFSDNSDKLYAEGRNNFIYVGGTGGNIQKGLDLMLEAFSQVPDANLYIYCKVEDDILNYYTKELKMKNIHYIYHWRFKFFNFKLKSLLKRINYSIHAPINCGLGTAFIGSMASGLIPVGYIDFEPPHNSAILIDNFQVESIIECIKEAQSKSKEWCQEASKLTVKNYEEYWSVNAFRRQFRHLIQSLKY